MWLASINWLQILDAVVSVIAAYLLALPLALEREAHAPTSVGLRTVPLVSVGACAYVLISRMLYDQGIYTADGMARTLRAVMTGIGFIGGGAIVKHTQNVRGLATGAAVWTSGAIGAAVAHGHYAIAIVLGVANVIILEIPRRLARVRRARKRTRDAIEMPIARARSDSSTAEPVASSRVKAGTSPRQ
jgi:putative Mg2+ transporter-C (MgtC) family protein